MEVLKMVDVFEDTKQKFKEQFYDDISKIEKFLYKRGVNGQSKIVNLGTICPTILILENQLCAYSNIFKRISEISPNPEKKIVQNGAKGLVSIMRELNNENGIFNPDSFGNIEMYHNYREHILSIVNNGIMNVGDFQNFIKQDYLNTAVSFMYLHRLEKAKDKDWYLRIKNTSKLWLPK